MVADNALEGHGKISYRIIYYSTGRYTFRLIQKHLSSIPSGLRCWSQHR